MKKTEDFKDLEENDLHFVIQQIIWTETSENGKPLKPWDPISKKYSQGWSKKRDKLYMFLNYAIRDEYTTVDYNKDQFDFDKDKTTTEYDSLLETVTIANHDEIPVGFTINYYKANTVDNAGENHIPRSKYQNIILPDVPNVEEPKEETSKEETTKKETTSTTTAEETTQEETSKEETTTTTAEETSTEREYLADGVVRTRDTEAMTVTLATVKATLTKREQAVQVKGFKNLPKEEISRIREVIVKGDQHLPSTGESRVTTYTAAIGATLLAALLVVLKNCLEK